MIELLCLMSKYPTVDFIFAARDGEISIDVISKRGLNYGRLTIDEDDFDEYELIEQLESMLTKKGER